MSTPRGDLLRHVAALASATVAGSLKDRPSAPYKRRAVDSLVREALQRCDLID